VSLLSADTKSEAAGPSEAAVQAGAHAVWKRTGGWPSTAQMENARIALTAAMAPALGDDRLVVAGVERQRTISEVVEKLRGKRPTERRCEYCNSKRALPVCGEADRGVFSCRMANKPVSSWADFIERELGGKL
jgi:molybdopterin converting factor small subunit